MLIFTYNFFQRFHNKIAITPVKTILHIKLFFEINIAFHMKIEG